MSFEGKTALVTGATSGIGRAIALELAREGADVIVSDRDAARGAETVTAIQNNGGAARFVAADVSDLESVANLAQKAGDIDVLVNNAGSGAFMPTTGQDVASFEAMFDTNVRGTFFLTAALVREAYRIGLVQEVVEPGHQLERAIELAGAIATKSAPLGVKTTLASAHRARLEGEEPAFARLDADMAMLFDTADGREGLQSFIERREARFTGQ